MRRPRSVVPALAIIAVGLAACGDALRPTGATGAAVITKLGLQGKWALDCAADFSRENPHMIYNVPSVGAPTEQLLARDPRLDRVTPLSEIVELEGGFVQWVQKAAGGQVTAIIKVEGLRQKTWNAVMSDGTVFVADGKFSGGSQTPWFNKCAGG
jgi:hypothetical protein